MRIHPIPLITGLLLCTLISYSQKDTSFALKLRGGSFTPVKNFTVDEAKRFGQRLEKVNGKSFAYIQFEKIPTETQRQQLKLAGIELLEYIPEKTYSVLFLNKANYTALQSAGARSLFSLSPQQKMHPALAKGIYPSWAVRTPGMVDLWVSFPKPISFDEIKTLLNEKNIVITTTNNKEYNIIGVKISKDRIIELAGFPFIEYMEPAPHGDQLLNIESRSISKANILQTSVANGGYNLRGEGVTIGIGDDSDPHYHIDFKGRIINRAATGHNYHGTHVTGTVGAGGIRMEEYRGYAPKSTIISQVLSGIISNTPSYVSDFGMVVTNNSYGDIVGDCSNTGYYSLQSRIADLQLNNYVNLQHVFAAGNDGTLSCLNYPTGFSTVLSGYQSSKNILTVGSIQKDKIISSFSSRGPVRDGRIKPEITAVGSLVFSTVPFNIHGFSSGTSMSTPAVTGGAALLYQYYRQQNGGANPKSGLIKSLLCNGADDLGNAGPDFTFGFGNMNLLRSIEMLQTNRYIISSVNNGVNNTHNITVPASTAQLKIMLYWNDPAASVFASPVLVNDLDLEVTTPAPATVLPQILDTLPANVNNVATTGADHSNNIEQVLIDNPANGTYTITVKGTSVTQSPPQEYFVVYNFLPVETKLTYPIGGEAMKPGETIQIEWESYGSPANTFTLDYSLNNGSSWNTISTTIASNLRSFNWAVPNVQAEQALIRITKNSTAQVSTSLPIVILGIPTVSVSAVQCQGYFSFDWTSVTGATDYEVFSLIGDEMTSLGTTTQTNYTLSGLDKDSLYWVSVRARVNGKPGRRAIAQTRQPNSGTCAGTISDNDLLLDSVIAPLTGRDLTSTALTATTQIKARIKNLDDANVTSIKIRYSLNSGSSWTEETVNTTINPGASYTHTFSTTENFSAIGTYELWVEVINLTAADPVTANNLVIRNFRQLPNVALNLASINTDDLETAVTQEHLNDYTGLNGIDRFDFVNSESWGRARTFVNTGIAYSGSKAITLDYDGNFSGGVTNFLTGTYNLSNYNASIHDLRLDFRYKNHGQTLDLSNPYDKVWIRGNDGQQWVEVYDLYANQLEQGSYKKTTSIELSDSLLVHGQNTSTSFQIRWGQFGHILTADDNGGEGYTFDDIRIYTAIDDIQMISIDTPTVISCGLNNMVPVKVTVRNASSSAISNIPVRLVVDGGTPVIETITFSIPANSSYQYTFTATADLSATGNHTVLVNVQYGTDNFKDNDTATVNLINSVLYNSFPHIENFESSDGGWYPGGNKISWEYGLPASIKINKAASGTKAWKTKLNGNYNDDELSYLFSPCYNITGMTNPTLSLSIALDLEDCGGTLCDGVYFEYSQNGLTWTRLGTTGVGKNWYNRNFGGGNTMWSVQNYTRWHVATVPLPTGLSIIRFRIVLTSDPFVNREGVAIDDIHVYDNTMGIYDGVTMGSAVTQNITGGTSWIDFTSSGKLVASIQPNNQNMGNTDVQAYINTGGVRNDGKQYYHDRNITIKPVTTALSDSAIVRFYFLDTETENLINATGCSGCTKPAMASELGVTKYSDPDDAFENGSLGDNVQGIYSFLDANWNRKIPFDKGYYVEFRVKDFSEFWLNNGGSDLQSPLPVELISFSAKKKNDNDVLLQWKTALEQNVNRYEIELAKGSDNYQQHRFIKIGEVNSLGNTTSVRNYEYTDAETGKSGVRYYRLKIVDKDNTFVYSPVRPVVFKSDIQYQVYPNPSEGMFNLVYQISDGEVLKINLYDVNGKLVTQFSKTGNGFLQKTHIDLRSPKYAKGIYLLKLDIGEKIESLRLVKH